MNPDQLRECEKIAIELAKRAGLMMMETSGRNTNIETKLSPVDLVTETDKAVEKLVFDELKKKFPDHRFIGEESFTGKVNLTDCPTWIIDPIDGTMNFVHTFPFCCISIGLTVGKEVIFGLIYSPFLNKLYTAKKGQGAYCNGEPIHVRACDSFKSALLINELGSNRTDEHQKIYFGNLAAIGWQCQGVRSLGSAALNACMLANGYVDAYFEYGLHCWDLAAGSIIIQEAGGTVLDPEGGPFNLMSRRILAASNEKVAREISGLIVGHSSYEHD